MPGHHPDVTVRQCTQDTRVRTVKLYPRQFGFGAVNRWSWDRNQGAHLRHGSTAWLSTTLRAGARATESCAAWCIQKIGSEYTYHWFAVLSCSRVALCLSNAASCGRVTRVVALRPHVMRATRTGLSCKAAVYVCWPYPDSVLKLHRILGPPALQSPQSACARRVGAWKIPTASRRGSCRQQHFDSSADRGRLWTLACS